MFEFLSLSVGRLQPNGLRMKAVENRLLWQPTVIGLKCLYYCVTHLAREVIKNCCVAAG